MTAQIQLVAAEIVRRIPAMQADSPANNADLIANMIAKAVHCDHVAVNAFNHYGILGKCQKCSQVIPL